LQNAQAKHEEVLVSWFPSIAATGYLAGPTPEHYLKGGAFDANPSDPSHLRTLDYFGGQLGVQLHADVQVVQPLYSFGKFAAGKGATQHLVSATEALLARARDQASYDAARAYWGYQTARNAGEAVQKVHQMIKVLGDALPVGPILIGAARPAHILTPSTTARGVVNMTAVAVVEAQQAAALKGRDLAIHGMRTLLALKPEEPLEVAQEALPDPPAQPAAETVQRRALEKRPELRAAEEAVQARQALVDLETARLWPDLGLVAGARFTETTNASNPQSPFVSNPFHEASAYAALAIHGTFEIPQKLARRRQAEADLMEALATRRGAEQLVRLEVQQALGDLAEARTKVDRYTRETAIGKQLATEDTLLYARADGARLEALYNAQLAWAALEKAAGGPLQ